MSSALPPGSTGVPGLGETLSFLKDPYAFVADREKLHGRVFKTSLFGKKTAVLVGADAAARYIDLALVERQGSQPDPVFRLFAGPSLPHLDGQAHLDRKAIMLQAFSRDALTSYLSGMIALVRARFERWSAKPDVRLVDETKRLALESVARDMLGVTSADDLARLESLYMDIEHAFTSLPLPLPGTRYSRGLKAVASLLAFYRGVVAERRRSPGNEGLSRVLAFKTASGVAIGDDDAARELHHLVIAGRVVYAHMTGSVLALAKKPAIADRIRQELARVAPDGSITVERLHAMPYLTEVMLEVKRTSPVVPGIFGRAKADITLGEYTIPRGWQIMFGLRQSLVDGTMFSRPESFEPSRFDDAHKEHLKHEHALVPHGPGKPATSHHCAGTDYASQLTKVFLIALARDFDVTLPDQALDYFWGQLTPDPKDGLRAKVKPRGA